MQMDQEIRPFTVQWNILFDLITSTSDVAVRCSFELHPEGSGYGSVSKSVLWIRSYFPDPVLALIFASDPDLNPACLKIYIYIC